MVPHQQRAVVTVKQKPLDARLTRNRLRIIVLFFNPTFTAEAGSALGI
jgi:hypothetical protein